MTELDAALNQANRNLTMLKAETTRRLEAEESARKAWDRVRELEALLGDKP